MLGSFLKSGKTASRNQQPSAPAGARLYAIGDIHGRADLLADMRRQIRLDIAQAGKMRTIAVFLGDYIDRGPQSRDVVEILAHWDASDAAVFLRGNHEQMLLDFLDNPQIFDGWRHFGGLETLQSYSLSATDMRRDDMFPELRDALVANMPQKHLAFLRDLPLRYQAGDYFFCHAGVDPRFPVGQQGAEALLWIREPFLESRKDFGKFVVHGHSPSERPDEQPNRLGLDTGAYASGVLTCAVLEGRQRRFLTASAGGLANLECGRAGGADG